MSENDFDADTLLLAYQLGQRKLGERSVAKIGADAAGDRLLAAHAAQELFSALGCMSPAAWECLRRVCVELKRLEES